MASELTPIDISGMPEVLHLAQEVRATGQARVLRRADEDLAVLTPVKSVKSVKPVKPVKPVRRTRVPRGRPFTRDDPLWDIVGIAHSEGPGDVSQNKYKYLAEAYGPRDK